MKKPTPLRSLHALVALAVFLTVGTATDTASAQEGATWDNWPECFITCGDGLKIDFAKILPPAAGIFLVGAPSVAFVTLDTIWLVKGKPLPRGVMQAQIAFGLAVAVAGGVTTVTAPDAKEFYVPALISGPVLATYAIVDHERYADERWFASLRLRGNGVELFGKF